MHSHYYFESLPSRYDIFLQYPPKLLYIGLVKNVKNWISKPSNHTFYEILYFYKGNGTITVDGKVMPVKSGDLIVYQPGQIHSEKTSEKTPFQFVFLAFHSDVSLHGSVDLIPEQDELPFSFQGVYRFYLEDLLFQMLKEAQTHEEGYDIMCNSYLTNFIVLFNRIRTAMFQSSKPAVESQKIKEYIDKNYNRNLTLDHLSEVVYISKHHLTHIFKNEVGVPPITYMIMKRMDEAKRLLLETDKSVADISQEIGYDNPNYFSQVFKKLEGLSPGKYRQTKTEN